MLTCGAQCFSNPENFLGSLPALATMLLIRSYRGLNAAGGSGAPEPSRICAGQLTHNTAHISQGKASLVAATGGLAMTTQWAASCRTDTGRCDRVHHEVSASGLANAC